MKKTKGRVFVGLSGGVDSSVSLALLKKEGYEVTGVFIKSWHPDWFPCDWKSDRRDAMRVCALLDVPFITLDLEKEYKKSVVDYMIKEYKQGRTPNPDVMCNKEIKFGAFLSFAKRKGAQFIATGHYAQVKVLSRNNFSLVKSLDKEKDQTYFLWTLSNQVLQNVLFPVGHLRKNQVRVLAKKFKLPTAEKKDSQGLCFIGKVDMKDFLSHFTKAKKGAVLDSHGKKIGHHPGALFFTIGQRHGFTVRNHKEASLPLYVVSKDIEKNTITVSSLPKEDKEIFGVSSFFLSETQWNTEIFEVSRSYFARARYRQKLFPIEITKEGGRFRVILKDKMMNLSPGQSLVVYDKERCIGGGIIEIS